MFKPCLVLVIIKTHGVKLVQPKLLREIHVVDIGVGGVKAKHPVFNEWVGVKNIDVIGDTYVVNESIEKAKE